MLKKIKINPVGGMISVKIEFIGLIVASYKYLLWEAHSNQVLESRDGNNQNPFDDTYLLPMPTARNLGRIIEVMSRFVGLDPENFPQYTVKVTVFQDGAKVDDAVEVGIVTGASQGSQIFILLESKLA